MIRLSIALLFAICTLSATAQSVTITGTVRDSKTHRPTSGINVMLQNAVRNSMFRFTITKEDGTYSLNYTGKADTLVVVASGFNIKEQARIIRPRNQVVDFIIESEALKIREVVVKTPPVTRRNDTLTYNVAKYSDVIDQSIGDVLKKMPGIEVAKSGQIKYNGKSINTFYIEDMDMLGGRYGIATNNVRAKDIASVQVFENHQPIKALRDLSKPETAAINLKLKPEAKGTWNSILQLGAGYKPVMWNAESLITFFGRTFQTISTYKTNNSGDDISSELRSAFGGLSSPTTMLSVSNPSTPAVAEERYLNNNIHAISNNTITKLKKDLEMTTSAQYTHDYRTAEGSMITTHYLPNQAPLVISELTSAASRMDKAEVDLLIRANASKHYLSNKVSFSGRWDNNLGSAINNNTPVNQQFRLPSISFGNYFQNTKRFGRNRITFTSETAYHTQPSSLRIRPMLYPEVFDSPKDYPDAIQTLDSRQFRTRNSASTSYNVKNWFFSLSGEVNAQIEWMQSALAPMNSTNAALPAVDTMRNNIYWRAIDIKTSPNITYRIGDQFSFSFYLPIGVMFLHTEDKIQNSFRSETNVLLSPNFFIRKTITPDLKISASASYNESVGSLYDTYSGYIMTNYNSISSKNGDISHRKSQNYSTELTYANAIRALFCNVNASYNRSRNNLMYGTTYLGSFSRIESVNIPNKSSGYRVRGKISKRFDGIATTINLSGGFSRSWNNQQVQGVITQTSFDVASADFGFNTRFTRIVRLDYVASYNRSQSHIEGGRDLDPIDVLTQNADMNFIIKKQFICRVGAAHYYNAAIGGSDRSMFFLDAGLSYKTKRMEYTVEARNLLDTGSFRSVSDTNITNHVTSYLLRPASIMFKVKFSLR